jgi:hypothetical protein
VNNKEQEKILHKCRELLRAYQEGKLGDQTMPEDTHPEFSNAEKKLAFFTLPMALNYQRNSYRLWEEATKAFEDAETHDIFDIAKVAKMPQQDLRRKLMKYKVALQPNKHIATWQKISQTIFNNYGNLENLIKAAENDFLKLREIVQQTHKKDFPYLSGPKIFNYWSHILGEYADIKLNNREFIEIAPDTHVIQASTRLGALTKIEAENLSRDQISARWREILSGTEITPIDLHSPLWFWSRNGFTFKLS